MNSVLGNAALPALGFPIRRSAGQRLFSASPRLIAAVHVLRRLLVPRHPPCALSILTVSTRSPKRPGDVSVVTRKYPLRAVFKLRRGRRRGSPAVRSLETEQCSSAGASAPRGEGAGQAMSGRHSGSRRTPRYSGPKLQCLPRKEVIQPQLPLRLPCYDFTPITSPTFDGSLP